MDLKRRGLEMGGLLVVFLLRSCLLSAVDGTLTFLFTTWILREQGLWSHGDEK